MGGGGLAPPVINSHKRLPSYEPNQQRMLYEPPNYEQKDLLGGPNDILYNPQQRYSQQQKASPRPGQPRLSAKGGREGEVHSAAGMLPPRPQ